MNLVNKSARKVVQQLITIAVLAVLPVFVLLFSPIIVAKAAPVSETSTTVIVKNKLNNTYCLVDEVDTVCDLTQKAEGAKGKVTLTAGTPATVELEDVNADDVVISISGSAVLKASRAHLAKIEQIESASQLTISSGEYDLLGGISSAIDSANKLVIQSGVKITAVGPKYVINSTGNLIIESNVEVTATVNAPVGVGILANGISIGDSCKINIGYSDDTTPLEIIGIQSGWGNTINVNGKLNQRTAINIQANTGISTIYPDHKEGVGNVFVNYTDLNIEAVGGDALIAKYASINNDSNLVFTALSGIGIGTIQTTVIEASSVAVQAQIGLTSNGRTDIKNDAKVNLEVAQSGILSESTVDIGQFLNINIRPLTLEQSENVSDQSPVVGILAGSEIIFDILDGGQVEIESLYLETDKFGGAVLCGGDFGYFTPTLPKQVNGQNPVFLHVNDSGEVDETTKTTKTTDCEITIREHSTIDNQTIITSDKLQVMKAIGTARTPANSVVVTPIPVPLIVGLWYRYGILLILATLLIVLLFMWLIYLVLHKKPVLLIMNLQNDFVEGGAIGISGAQEKVTLITQYLQQHRKKYQRIFASREWHVNAPEHFISWPVHAIAESDGAQFVPEFAKLVDELKIEIINTGTTDDGYSALKGDVIPTNTKFMRVLNSRKVKQLVIIGMTYDYSILKTALEAIVVLGKKKVTILSNLTVSYSQDIDKITQKLNQEDVIIK